MDRRRRARGPGSPELAFDLRPPAGTALVPLVLPGGHSRCTDHRGRRARGRPGRPLTLLLDTEPRDVLAHRGAAFDGVDSEVALEVIADAAVATAWVISYELDHRGLHVRTERLVSDVVDAPDRRDVVSHELVEADVELSLIHISEPTRLGMISYA